MRVFACIISYITFQVGMGLQMWINTHASSRSGFSPMTMSWQFTNVPGTPKNSLKNLGGVGAQGEYYYIPTKNAEFKGPKSALEEVVTIPILPRSQVLGPSGQESLGIYDMKSRQLIYSIERGSRTFGYVYYSDEKQKVAFVGTLVKITNIERQDDGGMQIEIVGTRRFYVKKILGKGPNAYNTAQVQFFKDYTRSKYDAQCAENDALNELRYSVKLMKLLYPSNGFTLSKPVVENQPSYFYTAPVRQVVLDSQQQELSRMTQLSFAAFSMLKADPAMKLSFLQEPVLEIRFKKMYQVLRQSTKYLEGELKKRGLITDEGAKVIRKEALEDLKDMDMSTHLNEWNPDNYVDGQWVMQPTSM